MSAQPRPVAGKLRRIAHAVFVRLAADDVGLDPLVVARCSLERHRARKHAAIDFGEGFAGRGAGLFDPEVTMGLSLARLSILRQS